MSTYTIRGGGPAEADALAELATRSFIDSYAAHNRAEDVEAHIASAYGLAQQSRELADPHMHTLLAHAGERLVGFTQLRRGTPPPCVTGERPVEILRFYLDRTVHGVGLAQRLMAAACAAAREMGGQQLWLGVWENNPRAIAFYVKCGFRDVGTTFFDVGPDRQTDRVMLLALGDVPDAA